MPDLTHKTFIFYLLILFSFNLFGQQEKALYKSRLEIEEALYPPEDILSSSALVLFSVSKDIEASEWKNKVDELQGFFADQGIDAVAYLNVERLFNRPAKSRGMPEILRDRLIKNLIFFHYQGEEKTMFLGMGTLTGPDNLWTRGDTFWMRTTIDLEPVFDELDTYFRTGARRRTNLLVNDHAEFFEPKLENDFFVLTGNPSIRDDKKVAMRDWSPEFYEKLGLQRFMDESLNAPQQFESRWRQRHSLYQQTTNDTTNIVEIVPNDISDSELRQQDYDFELAMITGSHDQLEGFFPSDEGLSLFDGIRAVFYLRSLSNNAIYLPKGWSPREKWQDALDQILISFDSFLSVKAED